MCNVKKHFIVFSFLPAVFALHMNAQDPPLCDVNSTPGTVTTPYGWSQSVELNDELSFQDREDLDEYYIDDPDYADAEPVEWGSAFYSSTTYNCHGYAWYMTSEDDLDPNINDRVWINESATGTIQYIEDGASYKEVDEEIYPGWVFWSNGNHSARTTSTPNLWRSKWGCGPLMEHDSLTHPYTKSGFRYFKLCYIKQAGRSFVANEKIEACKHELENCSVATNIDLEIEYEDWLKISGTFSTSSGATLSFYPE